jgi:hypothetical protein
MLTRKYKGGKFRRWLANNVGHYVCPYPLVRDTNGKSSRKRKIQENVFTNVGTTIDPYKLTTRSRSRTRTSHRSSSNKYM